MNHKPTTTHAKEFEWQRLIEVAVSVPGHLGEVYNRFYSYSFLNQVYLLSQGLREPVATYKRWQTLGRQVLRGSKAYAIVRPIVVEQPNDDSNNPDKVVRFKRVNCLFGVSQTEGDDLPSVELPGWRLDQAIDALDVRQVPYQLLNGNVQGYSAGREYAVNPVAANPLHTALHELGHIVLGHTLPEARADYVLHRGSKEFQAEATAHLVLNELGQLTDETASHSRGYIQNWLHDERPADAEIRQVFTATDTILKAGRTALSGAGAADV